MTDCQHCTRKTELHLCTPCAHVLGDLLTELPWLLHQLDITLTRQDRITCGAGGAHILTNPNPINVGAMELARTASTALHQIALDVAEIHASERIPALVNATPARIATWLRNNLGAIQRHPKAGQHYRVIVGLVGERREGPIHHAINRTETRFAGPCPAIRCYDRHGTPIRCNTMLYAHDGEPITTCPRCLTDVDVEDNRRRTAAAHDLLPEQLLLDVLDQLGEHVPRVTFYAWVKTGKLLPRGFLTRTGIKAHQQRRTDPRVFSLTIARQLRREYSQEIDDDAQHTQTV